MSAPVQFHFDFGSPNTYFCHRVIPEIESRTGTKFEYFPVLLGGIFKATNNKSPMEQFSGVLNKNEYQALETERFMKKHGITEFQRNPHFPVNTLLIMRGAVYASGQSYFSDYIECMYRGMWEQGLNMAEAQVVQQVLSDTGLPAADILEAAGDPEVKQRLIDNTGVSVEMGSFGSPTFYVGDEIFFGKDKLHDVEEAILSQLA